MRLAAAILWTGALGYRVARPLVSSLSVEEKIAWGLAIGLLLQGALYSAFLLFGFEPGPVAMLAAGAAVGLGARPRRPEAARPPAVRVPGAARVLLGAAALAGLLFLIQAVVEPMWANDYLAIWGLKGKTIFLSASVPRRLFRDPATVWSHPEYPLLLPLALASLSAVAGIWNDHALALLFPALSAAILLALAGFFRRRSKPSEGAIAAVLVSLFFPLFQPFEVGMAEIPLALALVLLVLAVADGREGAGHGSVGRCAAAAFLACGFKQEGTLFVLLLAATTGGRSLRRGQRSLVPLALSSAAAANWAILRLLRGPLSDRDYDPGFLEPAKIPVLLSRLAAVAGAVVRDQILPLAIPLAALAALFLLTRRGGLEWVLPVLAAQIVGYVSVCAFSSFDPVWQARFVPRIAGALFPVLAAVVGSRTSILFESGVAAERSAA